MDFENIRFDEKGLSARCSTGLFYEGGADGGVHEPGFPWRSPWMKAIPVSTAEAGRSFGEKESPAETDRK